MAFKPYWPYADVDEYPLEIEKDVPWSGWFPAAPGPKPGDSPKHAEIARRTAVRNSTVYGMKLWHSQYVATRRGHHLTCKNKACRRKRACIGRRLPFDWMDFFGATMPPCVPLDDDGYPMAGEHEAAMPLYNLVRHYGWEEALKHAAKLTF
jgi:hypothetical protein